MRYDNQGVAISTGDAVTWGFKIYTIGDPRCIRSLRGLPGDSLSGTHAYPTMFGQGDQPGGAVETCFSRPRWLENHSC